AEDAQEGHDQGRSLSGDEAARVLREALGRAQAEAGPGPQEAPAGPEAFARRRRGLVVMAIQRTPMTRPGREGLRADLDRLKRVDRHAITKAIAEARAHGDLSENAEYHAAREKQSFIEGRIAELEGKVGAAEVIDPPTSGDRVTFASTVLL